jgi:hypothetical protein
MRRLPRLSLIQRYGLGLLLLLAVPFGLALLLALPLAKRPPRPLQRGALELRAWFPPDKYLGILRALPVGDAAGLALRAPTDLSTNAPVDSTRIVPLEFAGGVLRLGTDYPQSGLGQQVLVSGSGESLLAIRAGSQAPATANDRVWQQFEYRALDPARVDLSRRSYRLRLPAPALPVTHGTSTSLLRRARKCYAVLGDGTLAVLSSAAQDPSRAELQLAAPDSDAAVVQTLDCGVYGVITGYAWDGSGAVPALLLGDGRFMVVDRQRRRLVERPEYAALAGAALPPGRTARSFALCGNCLALRDNLNRIRVIATDGTVCELQGISPYSQHADGSRRWFPAPWSWFKPAGNINQLLQLEQQIRREGRSAAVDHYSQVRSWLLPLDATHLALVDGEYSRITLISCDAPAARADHSAGAPH